MIKRGWERLGAAGLGWLERGWLEHGSFGLGSWLVLGWAGRPESPPQAESLDSVPSVMNVAY